MGKYKRCKGLTFLLVATAILLSGCAEENVSSYCVDDEEMSPECLSSKSPNLSANEVCWFSSPLSKEEKDTRWVYTGISGMPKDKKKRPPTLTEFCKVHS